MEHGSTTRIHRRVRTASLHDTLSFLILGLLELNMQTILFSCFVGVALLISGCNRAAVTNTPPAADSIKNPYGTGDSGMVTNMPPAVDSIKGFQSIELGTKLEQLSARFKPVAPNVLASERFDSFKLRTVAELEPDEREWGGVPISEVKVRFDYDVVSEIELWFNQTADQWLVLHEAFGHKYGPPTTENQLEAQKCQLRTWSGHNTEVIFYTNWGDGTATVTFRSLSAKRAAQAEDTKRSNEDTQRRTDKAKEVSRKL